MGQTYSGDSIRQLAYDQTEGQGPGVVFLGGFRSDKEGTKALYLEEWAQRRRRAFLRFDYSGHGKSSGRFEDGTVGDWAEDAAAIMANLTEGPQILVGSSMGAWISLLLAREIPDRVAGLVTVAAAPDFTEDGIWASLSGDQKRRLETEGQLAMPSEYSDEPYVITRRLIEDGRKRLVLRSPLHLGCPVRFLQGTADRDVPVSVAMRLLDHAEGPDMRLTLVKGADHQFSVPECLALIVHAIEDVSARLT
jgi:pimeloyl-ACP methyl ester carboxylesterase